MSFPQPAEKENPAPSYSRLDTMCVGGAREAFQQLVSLPLLLVGLPLLAILLVLSIPVSFVGMCVGRIQEKRLKKRMLKRDRYLPWVQVEERMRLTNSPSTLIVVDAGLKNICETWWTEDDLLSSAPLYPVSAWCWYRYLSEETGKAVLTDLSDPILDQILRSSHDLDPACCRSLYSHLNIVVTELTLRGEAEAATKFVQVLGETVVDSIPALIATLADENADVRRMCRDTIRLAGPSAADAVPLLTRQLYDGPRGERRSIAFTLANLGPAGEEALKRAAECDKWPIRRLAAEMLD